MNTPLELMSRNAETAPFEALVAFKVSWQPRLMSIYSSQSPVGAPVQATVFLTQEEAADPLVNQWISGVVKARHGWRGYVQIDA